MNKADYIDELERRLIKLPDAERVEALRYYNDYFNEAGIQREAIAIEELGPPSRVAAQILAEYTVETKDSKETKKLAGFTAIILGIFAAPIALPLAIVIVLVLMMLAVTLYIAVFSAAFASVLCIASGIIITIFGGFYILTDLGAGLITMGGGLITASIGMFLFVPAKAAFGALGRFIMTAAAKSFNKITNRNVAETHAERKFPGHSDVITKYAYEKAPNSQNPGGVEHEK